MKICNKCGIAKPEDGFHKDRSKCDGFYGICKLCRQPRSKAYREQNLERVKSASAASYRKHRESYRAASAIRRRNYRLAHPLVPRVKKCPSREELRAYSRSVYRANLERSRAYARAFNRKHPERRRATAAKYRAVNADKRAALQANRDARKIEAPGAGVTAAEWRQALRDSMGVCVYCDARKVLTMEHIEPLAGGGEHDPSNIAAACLSCNSSKRTAPLLLWLARKAFFHAAELRASHWRERRIA